MNTQRKMPISPSQGTEFFWDKQEAEQFVSDLLARYPEMPYMTHASILEMDGNETANAYRVRYFVGSAD
jgi:hypothetical protein